MEALLKPPLCPPALVTPVLTPPPCVSPLPNLQAKEEMRAKEALLKNFFANVDVVLRTQKVAATSQRWEVRSSASLRAAGCTVEWLPGVLASRCAHWLPWHTRCVVAGCTGLRASVAQRRVWMAFIQSETRA